MCDTGIFQKSEYLSYMIYVLFRVLLDYHYIIML